MPAADESLLDSDTIGTFNDEVDDDLATPSGIAIIFETVRQANAAIDAGEAMRAESLVATVHAMCGAFGLSLDRRDTETDTEIDSLVAAREAARGARDFAAADRVRDELMARGIVLEDTPTGPVWRRT